MHLKIITNEKIVFDDDVDEIYSVGVDGAFGVLKGHVPFMTNLDIGITKVVQNGEDKKFTVMGGIFLFENEEATILTHVAENENEIDKERAMEALKRAQMRLNEKQASIDAKRAQAAVARAMVRLKIKLNDGK